MNNWRNPPVLENRHARLEPLQAGHAPALLAAASDGELWKLRVTRVPSPQTIDGYMSEAQAMRSAGTAMPFAVFDAAGEIVGSTRYCNLQPEHGRLEIGYTWYAARVQRTALNTAVKQLLLAHAFDTMGCIAVEFRTHHLNLRSQRAIERIGARRDGVLRQHMRMPDGTLRDTVVYSILDSEWPAIHHHLDSLMEQHR